MNRETHLDQNASGRTSDMRGEIEFRGVSFNIHPYSSTPKHSCTKQRSEAQSDEGEPILQNISFKVKPGQTVAIVGQTGAGKTSLAKLINRTYDVTAGQIFVDGVDVRDWNLAPCARRSPSSSRISSSSPATWQITSPSANPAPPRKRSLHHPSPRRHMTSSWNLTKPTIPSSVNAASRSPADNANALRWHAPS